MLSIAGCCLGAHPITKDKAKKAINDSVFLNIFVIMFIGLDINLKLQVRKNIDNN